MAHVKKNDKVYVLTGKDKGKTGLVLEVLPKKEQVKVQGVALVTRHVKARREGEKSEIRVQERYIHWSNVKLVE